MHMRSKLDQFQENIQKLSDMASRYSSQSDECTLDPPKIFDLAAGGAARVWKLFESDDVSIVKAHLSPNSEFPMHSHNAVEVIVLFAGAARYESSRTARDMMPGDCVRAEREMAHRMIARSEGAWFSVTTVPKEEGLTNAS
jgi:quercetin dioxygenase-like cupin family protein